MTIHPSGFDRDGNCVATVSLLQSVSPGRHRADVEVDGPSTVAWPYAMFSGSHRAEVTR